MNRKKWICTAAAITGLLLAVIVGLSVRHMKNGSYISASELAGQKRAEASKDQENVAETENVTEEENNTYNDSYEGSDSDLDVAEVDATSIDLARQIMELQQQQLN